MVAGEQLHSQEAQEVTFRSGRGKGWIPGTEIWEMWPELAERSSCSHVLVQPLGDFPQDKVNILHIEHEGQGALGRGEHSVSLLSCSLSVRPRVGQRCQPLDTAFLGGE